VKLLYVQRNSTDSNKNEVENSLAVSAKGIEKSSMQLHEAAAMLFPCDFDVAW